MAYVDGGAWWNILGWVSVGVGAICDLISISSDNRGVQIGFVIAGTIFGFIGTILTGFKK